MAEKGRMKDCLEECAIRTLARRGTIRKDMGDTVQKSFACRAAHAGAYCFGHDLMREMVNIGDDELTLRRALSMTA